MKIEDVLENFERRISAIETQLSQGKTSENPPQALEKLEKSFKELPGPYRQSSKLQVTDAKQTFNSSAMLAFIGIFFVILAGIFFIKITIDSGWLTPMRQILLAAAIGLIFFFTPQFFPKAEKEYGALIAGAGTTILHLAWLGSYSFHHILTAKAALICATVVGVFSILANFDKGNRIYVLVAMAGTYLSAPIVGYSTGDFRALSAFLIIWNISFSAAALMNKRRDIMFIASCYAVFSVLLLTGKAQGYDQQADLLTLQLTQFLIFSAAMFSYSAYHKSPLSIDESKAMLPLLLLFYFSTAHLVSAVSPSFASWFGVAIGTFVLAIYFFARLFISGELTSGPTLTTFATLTLIYSFYFQIMDESFQAPLALLIGIAVLTIWSQSLTARKIFFGPLIILFSTCIYGALLTIISDKSIGPMYFCNWGYGLFALFAVMGLNSIRSEPRTAKCLPLILTFGHLETMLGLYRFSLEISWSGALFVSITWGIYAAIILALAYRRRDKILGNSALTILLAVSLKAFFYDVSNTGSLIRVGCLLAEGLLLYSCGWIFKRMQIWKV